MPRRPNAQPPSSWFADQMAHTRKLRGWTQRELADRLAEQGVRLDNAAVAKIETGSRGLSLDEALAIAAVLGVSPLHLFVPRSDNAKVALAPKVKREAADVRAWAAGDEPLPDTDADFFHANVSDRQSALRRMIGWPRFWALQVATTGELPAAWASGNPDEMQEVVETIGREVDRLRDEIALLRRKEARRGR